MIGISLSFCIRDIVTKKVALSDVEKIITGTKAATPEHWDDILQRYKAIYWKDFPDEAEKLARDLLAEGKIEQPRLIDGRSAYVGQGHWVTSVDEIQWGRAEVV